MGGGEGTKTTVILLLIFIRGATKDVGDIIENNVTARTEERKGIIARVRSGPKLAHLSKEAKLAQLGKEGRVVNNLRENQEGCPPRLAEFLV